MRQLGAGGLQIVFRVTRPVNLGGRPFASGVPTVSWLDAGRRWRARGDSQRRPVGAVRGAAGLERRHHDNRYRRRSPWPGISGQRPDRIDVELAVGVVARELLAGVEEDARAVVGGVAEERAVAPFPPFGPVEIERRRVRLALVDVLNRVAVTAEQGLVGREEDARAVLGGLVEVRIERAVARRLVPSR